jgi:hypothetical protein
MRLTDTIEYQPTGPCKVHVDNVCRVFGKSCITKHVDEYKLYNRRAKIKVTLHTDQAKAIITKLGLVEQRHPIFARCVIFTKPMSGEDY